MKQIESILKSYCPSMDNLFLDHERKEFRQRIFDAMEEYATECVKSSLEKASENACIEPKGMMTKVKLSITDEKNIVIL